MSTTHPRTDRPDPSPRRSVRSLAAFATAGLVTALAGALAVAPAAGAAATPGSTGGGHAPTRVTAHPGAGAAAKAKRYVTVIGHRGAKAYAPENTLSSVRKGVALGADKVEIDVQESKDHHLMVIHDATLDRTTNVESEYPDLKPWNVGDLTYAQIEKLDAGSWFGSKYAGAHVPTLREVLDTLRPTDTGLLLEIKNPELYPGVEKRIAAALKNHPYWWDAGPGTLVVESFDWDSMHTFHGYAPRLAAGLIGAPSYTEMKRMSAWADYVNPSADDLSKAYVDHIRAYGMHCYAWTTDDPGEMRKMAADGVNGIGSNEPDTLRRALHE